MSHVTDGAVSIEFAEALGYLAEALGSRVSETRIRIYANLFADVPIKAFRIAIGHCAREHEKGFLPTPGEIRKYLGPGTDDAALIAWSGLTQAVSTVGAYSSVKIEDPAAARALLAVFGDWPSFCQMEEGPALAMKRQEFLAAYRAARLSSGTPVQLKGLCEMDPETIPTVTIKGVIATGQRLLGD